MGVERRPRVEWPRLEWPRLEWPRIEWRGVRWRGVPRHGLAIGLLLATLALPALSWSPPAPPAGARASSAGGPGHRPPVPGALVAAFAPPDTPFGVGHRGVDLAVSPREAVQASGPGTVAFAGRVAGRPWLALDHAGGLRTTYGPLAEILVVVGDRVGRGPIVAHAAGSAHGRPGRLHWGARRAGRYLDPLGLVAREVATLVGPGDWWIVRHRGAPLPGVRDRVDGGSRDGYPSCRRPASSRGPFVRAAGPVARPGPTRPSGARQGVGPPPPSSVTSGSPAGGAVGCVVGPVRVRGSSRRPPTSETARRRDPSTTRREPTPWPS